MHEIIKITMEICSVDAYWSHMSAHLKKSMVPMFNLKNCPLKMYNHVYWLDKSYHPISIEKN